LGFRYVSSRRLLLLAVLLVAPLAVLAVSCGGSSNTNKKDAEATIRSAIDKWNAKDADGFSALFTDKGVSELAGAEGEGVSVSDLRAQFKSFVGESPIELKTIDVTKASGSTADADVTTNQQGVIEGDKFVLTKTGSDWKIDGYDGYGLSPDIPSGYKTVDLQTAEFAFGFDREAVTSGKIAFKVENAGKQVHEVALEKVPADFDLDAALQADEPPADVEDIGRIEIKPGRTYNMVLLKDLAPGRYVMICFMPDTEGDGTPHALKGMTADFTVK
jgi:hypothetical protein